MDPFEVRMQFLSLLRRLNAIFTSCCQVFLTDDSRSQPSIQKVVTYALRYFTRCGDDLWDCLVEECQKGTINTRMNIFYLLDTLCETSLLIQANSLTAETDNNSGSFYVNLVSRDLAKIVDNVVPEGREGLPNLMSVTQILANWRNKRIIDPQQVDDIVLKLNSRKASVNLQENSEPAPEAKQSSAQPPHSLSRHEVFKRIEEDRERHKRLRERRWVQPISHNPNPQILPQLATFMANPDDNNNRTAELTIDIEFDNEWETTSDWNEDDDEAAFEENTLCYPSLEGRGKERDMVPRDFSVSR